MDLKDRVKGCLLGGAVGDALGAPVARMPLAEIRRRFGAAGIADFAEAHGRRGLIGDSTQLTLFTADGLVRAYVRQDLKGICAPEAVIHHAYLRWLLTQGVTPRAEVAVMPGWPDGWLVAERRLWARRTPGRTSIAALSATVKLGERAANESKGCAAITRVAPVGLACRARDDERSPAFELGEGAARLTHGHPAAWLGAGAFALLIACLVEGLELRRAVDAMLGRLAALPRSDSVTRAFGSAVKLIEKGEQPTPERVESLGRGWIAEEALAIALYCAMSARDFEHGVRLAVNHSGNSGGTGSLVGQLLGAAWGAEAVPGRWVADLELRDVLESMADDLVAVRTETLNAEAAWTRSPGW